MPFQLATKYVLGDQIAAMLRCRLSFERFGVWLGLQMVRPRLRLRFWQSGRRRFRQRPDIDLADIFFGCLACATPHQEKRVDRQHHDQAGKRRVGQDFKPPGLALERAAVRDARPFSLRFGGLGGGARALRLRQRLFGFPFRRFELCNPGGRARQLGFQRFNRLLG